VVVVQTITQSSINNKGEFGMLKKLLKVALAACLVAGMSSVTMAAENVQFSVQAQTLIGQVNPGTKDANGDDNPSYLDTVTRSDFEYKFISGKMFVYGELEQFYYNQTATLDLTAVKIGYNMANPGQFIEIGKIWIGSPFSYEFDGISTSSGSAVTGKQGWGMRSGWYSQSDWGIKYNMLLSPTMGLMAGYTTGTTMLGAGDGSSLGLAWWGIFGPLQARVGIDNETRLARTAGAEAYTGSFNYFGVKYGISDTMSISLDYLMSGVAAEIWAGPAGEKFNEAQIAIVFIGQKLGPGDLKFQYATDTDTRSWDDDYKSVATYTNLAYMIPVDKGVGIEIVYLSKKTVVTTAAGDGDATGPVTIGGGFYGRF
jgi:hypothetical protein